MDKLVSVVMAVRNEEAFVRAAVECIKNQSYPRIELIIVDDGSSDSTSSVLQRCQFSGLNVIRGDGSGLAAALNVGLAQAQGELIARQDADDFSFPSRISEQVHFLSRNERCGYCGTHFEVAESGCPSRTFAGSGRSEHLVGRFLEMDVPLPHSSLLFRRSVLDSVGGYGQEFKKSEDYDLHLRLLSVTSPGCVPTVLVRVAIRATSMQRVDGLLVPAKYTLYARVKHAVRNGEIDDPRSKCASFEIFDREVVDAQLERVIKSDIDGGLAAAEFRKGAYFSALTLFPLNELGAFRLMSKITGTIWGRWSGGYRSLVSSKLEHDIS